MIKDTVKSYLCNFELPLHTKETKTALENLIAINEPQLEAVFRAGNPAYKDNI